MKKMLLFLPVLGAGLLCQAQSALKDSRLTTKMQDAPVVMQHQQHTGTAATNNHRTGGSRALSSVLHSQRVGSAGNMLSVLESECNQLDVNDSLNVVTFIHRNDAAAIPGSNVAQYSFDISRDRGLTWQSNNGPITNDISIDNVSINGRFPQALIYNPAGNTIADSAYLIYSGTWHDNVTWVGEMRGRGHLSGDTASFNVHIDPVNNRHVEIASGLCQGAPGVFWNVNVDYSGNFNGGNALTNGIIVYKGVWDDATKDVNWTSTIIPQAFQSTNNSGSLVSIATSSLIAFDPSGKYGWISILGDITNDNVNVYQPIFWQSTDSGQTWTGPTQVSLADIQGLSAELNPMLIDGSTPSSGVPTTAFDADLTVDINGNPHLLTIVGNGNDYSIEAAGYDVWDITYDAGALQGCTWKGVHLANINTLRGTFTNDASPITEDNRPIVSRSADGSKIFFFWNESDFNFLQTSDNDVPNLFGRGIDVVLNKMTSLYNFTEGDTLWGGETVNTAGGVFGGSIFPQGSPIAWENGSDWNIPFIMTQIDYNHDPSLGLGSSEQPAAFWYISNINVPDADFTQPLDQVPPTVTLAGQDTVSVLLNNSYTEAGATAFDCTDGAITPVIQNEPDTSVAGIYNVLYIATDAAGNSDTAVRTVIVGAIPTADFSWSFQNPNAPNVASFTDLSTYNPSSWLWTFGDGGGSVLQAPSHAFPAVNTYNVCLKATNSFGTSAQVCHDVVVTALPNGISDPEFAQQLSMYPNPTGGKVAITVNADSSPEMTVSVYNILGEVVKAPVTYGAGTTQMTLDMSDVANGAYLVKIQTANATAVKPLSVNHR